MSRWSIREQAKQKLTEPGLGDKVHKATLHTVVRRNQLVSELPDWPEMRQRARRARLHALDNHRQLLAQLTATLEARGATVTVAKDPADARRLITRLVTEVGRRVTKSKSMTSEEIELNPALEAAGVEVTETDLGELIVQLAGQPPSHITAPSLHLSVEDTARIFRQRLGMAVPDWVDDPAGVDEATRQELAKAMSLEARAVLRERFLNADVGISGGNFLVAESGTLVLIENEGNIQLTTCLPRRHIVLAGIDKLIATEEDLALLLRMLPISATGQRQSCYVSLFADRHPDLHVVLLDNGRSKLATDPLQRDLLTCIRCGACLNSCPVYRNIGGHAYGGAYPGPIGSLLLPHLVGPAEYGSLPFASSLCGACSEACPVAIPLHRRLLELRARFARAEVGLELDAGLTLAGLVMGSGRTMAAATRLYRLARPMAPLAGAGRAWRAARDLPPPPPRSFRSWYRRRTEPTTTRTSPATAAAPTSPAIAPAAPAAPPLSPLELFAERFRELGPGGESELHRFADADAAVALLRERIAALPAAAVLVEGEASAKQEYLLGVTNAALLIAETGGVMLDHRDRIAARAAVLVETHIVVAQPEQIVADLTAALAIRSQRREEGSFGDFQVIATGASRTADIEKVLVIPAHGPKRLVVVLCDQPVDLSRLRD